MSRAPHSRAKPKTALRGLATRVLVLLTLLAFVLQGFATQTHIHQAAVAGVAAADVFDGTPSPGHDKAPAKNPDQNCPLCQQFASAGNFVTPAAAAVLLPSLSVSVIQVVVLATHAVAPVSHDWRGRAPPRR